MKINITPHHFQELIRRGYSLDMVFVLDSVYNNLDLDYFKGNEKIKSLLQTLIRKELVSEDGKKVTLLGEELIVFLNTKDDSKLSKRKNDNSEFQEWWDAFPPSDNFTYKGKTFTGCRSIRVNKDACRLKFNAILLEGECSATYLINALKTDVQLKKETSVKTGINKLTYLQNSLTYLNQKAYEAFAGIHIESISPIQDGVNI